MHEYFYLSALLVDIRAKKWHKLFLIAHFRLRVVNTVHKIMCLLKIMDFSLPNIISYLGRV